MAESDLSELVSGKSEALDVEYKAWMDTSDGATRAKLAKHIAALANHGGGYLIFGVDDATRQPMGETTLDRRLFSQDAISNIVKKYLDPRLQVRVVDAEHAGVRYPVVIVPSHGARPVVAVADGPQIDGKPVGIRQGDIYIRAPGPESVAIRRPEEWDKLLNDCLTHRADIMGKVMRLALARQGRPSPQTNDLLQAAMNATMADFVDQVKDLSSHVSATDKPRVLEAARMHCALGYALVGEDGELVQLDRLRDINDRAAVAMRQVADNGWTSFLPLTVPERAPQMRNQPLLGQDRAYLEGMRLATLNFLPRFFDYWRIYETGVAVSCESYREDYNRARNDGRDPYLTVLQILWRLHSLLAHARLVGQQTLAAQHVVVRMDWRGLAGRMLWWDHDGTCAADGKAADDRFVKTITLTWPELRDTYFDSFRRVALPIFDVFAIGGGGSPDQWVTRARVEQEFKRFNDANARLFDD